MCAKIAASHGTYLTTACSGIDGFGIPDGNRTRVAAVKEKRFTVIQRETCGMDSTVRYSKELYGLVIGPLMDPAESASIICHDI